MRHEPMAGQSNAIRADGRAPTIKIRLSELIASHPLEVSKCCLQLSVKTTLPHEANVFGVDFRHNHGA